MKKIKGLLIISIFLIVPVLFSPTVKAVTIAELQIQIQALLSQIQTLQQQLKGIAWCHTFNKNLRLGDTGSEVIALRTALGNSGFPSEVRSGTGEEFTEQTASAVVQFQEKYASEILAPYELTKGTGFVGPSTRAKLNALYGCSLLPHIDSIALFTNLKGSPQFAVKGANFLGSTPFVDGQSAPYINLTDSSLTLLLESQLAIPGSHAVYLLNPKTGQSNTVFVDVGNSDNKPPVISGVSGPTNLYVNQTGTWTISASDPENGTLSYSIEWGDEYVKPAGSTQSSFIQTATFTHSYSIPVSGVYAVKFYVKDDAGNIAQSSVNVNVIPNSIGLNVTFLEGSTTSNSLSATGILKFRVQPFGGTLKLLGVHTASNTATSVANIIDFDSYTSYGSVATGIIRSIINIPSCDIMDGESQEITVTGTILNAYNKGYFKFKVDGIYWTVGGISGFTPPMDSWSTPYIYLP